MKPSDRQNLEKKLANALQNSPAMDGSKKKKRRRRKPASGSKTSKKEQPKKHQAQVLKKSTEFFGFWKRRSKLSKIAIILFLLFFSWIGSFVFNFSLAKIRQGLVPDTILVLGGGPARDIKGIEAAYRYPDANLIVSASAAERCTYDLVVDKGQISMQRFYLDMRADDTLTNFTATLPIMKRIGSRKVLVVTTSGHWPRSELLAKIVLGSNGIAFESYLGEGLGNNESETKTKLDSIRALAWMILGERVLKGDYAPEGSRAEQECHTYKQEEIEMAIARGKSFAGIRR